MADLFVWAYELGHGWLYQSFVRIEGRPVGICANNCHHLSGAIDANAADKATRFINLCDCFDIPVTQGLCVFSKYSTHTHTHTHTPLHTPLHTHTHTQPTTDT